jgi:hypothetical protein
MGPLPSADSWHLFGKWGTASGRLTLAGIAVGAAAVGVGLILMAKRLPASVESRHKTLFSLLGVVLAIVLLFDIVFVIEAIAHVIWPNFVDTGS